MEFPLLKNLENQVLYLAPTHLDMSQSDMLDKSLSKPFPGFHPSFSSKAYGNHIYGNTHIWQAYIMATQKCQARDTSNLVFFLQPVWRKMLREKFREICDIISDICSSAFWSSASFGARRIINGVFLFI